MDFIRYRELLTAIRHWALLGKLVLLFLDYLGASLRSTGRNSEGFKNLQDAIVHRYLPNANDAIHQMPNAPWLYIAMLFCVCSIGPESLICPWGCCIVSR